MKITIERSGEEQERDFTGTAQQLLDDLEINPQTVLVLKDGTLVPEDEDLTGAAHVKIVTVVSGG